MSLSPMLAALSPASLSPMLAAMSLASALALASLAWASMSLASVLVSALLAWASLSAGRRAPGRQLEHKAIAPEDVEVAAEGPIKRARRGREVRRVGLTGDIEVASRAKREVGAAFRVRPAKECGVAKRRAGRVYPRDRDIGDAAVEGAVERVGGHGEVGRAGSARHPGAAEPRRARFQSCPRSPIRQIRWSTPALTPLDSAWSQTRRYRSACCRTRQAWSGNQARRFRPPHRRCRPRRSPGPRRSPYPARPGRSSRPAPSQPGSAWLTKASNMPFSVVSNAPGVVGKFGDRVAPST